MKEKVSTNMELQQLGLVTQTTLLILGFISWDDTSLGRRHQQNLHRPRGNICVLFHKQPFPIVSYNTVGIVTALSLIGVSCEEEQAGNETDRNWIL